MADLIVLCSRRMRACYTMTNVLSIQSIFFVSPVHVLEMQTTAAGQFHHNLIVAMSNKKLLNVSRRCGNAYADQAPPSSTTSRQSTDEIDIDEAPHSPITARRSTDETDTDSIYTTYSEDPASDDDADYRLDYRARVLRRREAQARVNNTLHYAQDQINGGLQPVHRPAEDVARGRDQVYNVLDEAVFQAHVTVLVIWRLLVRSFWYTTSLLVWAIFDILRLIYMGIWLFLNVIATLLDFMIDLIGGAFGYIIDLLRRALLALPDLVQNIPWPTAYTILVAAGSLAVAVSMMHGFTSMFTYICSNPDLAQAWTDLPEVCKHASLNAVVQSESVELAKLVESSDITLNGIDNVANSLSPSRKPVRDLSVEAASLVHFARANNEGLASLPRGHDIFAISIAAYNNITAYERAAELFVFHHETRKTELESKAMRVLTNARSFRAHSPAERFFSESVYYFFPGTFSLTSVSRRTSTYLEMATHFASHKETAAILQHRNNMTQSMYNARQALETAREAIVHYAPFWKLECERANKASQSDHDKCHIDPEELNEALRDTLERTRTLEAELGDLYTLHQAINRGMTSLREDLKRLLNDARNTKGGKANAASARAILHQFLVQVGGVEALMPSGTYEHGLTLGEGQVRGSRWIKLENGTMVSLDLHREWENQY